LLLSALAFHVDDELARHRQRARRAQIFFDQRKGEVDARGDAGGRVERTVLDEKLIARHAQARKTLGDIASERPVRGDPPAVQ
jgi:hypothetical protein